MIHHNVQCTWITNGQNLNEWVVQSHMPCGSPELGAGVRDFQGLHKLMVNENENGLVFF